MKKNEALEFLGKFDEENFDLRIAISANFSEEKIEKLIDKISACGFNYSLENSAWQPLEIIVNKKNE
jgi:uncharacterized OsmC-like protein